MDKQKAKELSQLRKEYDYIDEQINDIIRGLILPLREEAFILSLRMSVIVWRDKNNQTISKECENTGCVAGGESASDFIAKPLEEKEKISCQKNLMN